MTVLGRCGSGMNYKDNCQFGKLKSRALASGHTVGGPASALPTRAGGIDGGGDGGGALRRSRVGRWKKTKR